LSAAVCAALFVLICVIHCKWISLEQWLYLLNTTVLMMPWDSNCFHIVNLLFSKVAPNIILKFVLFNTNTQEEEMGGSWFEASQGKKLSRPHLNQ
jgi:hypothetical protein